MADYLLDYSEYVESDDVEANAVASGRISYPKIDDIEIYREYEKAYGQWAYHTHCKFCGAVLIQVYKFKRNDFNHFNPEFGNVEIKECGICGWWESIDEYYLDIDKKDNSYESYEYVRRGLLKRYSIDDLTIPIDTLRDYIDKKPDAIRDISPYALEKLVADVFKNHFNCEVVHLGGPNDGGIDLLLIDGDIQRVVQIKRRSKGSPAESVRMIREFIGAMLLKDFYKGIFVTTANSFSRAATETSSIARKKNIVEYIELIDFARLRDICELNRQQINKPWSRFKIDYLKT